MDIQQAYRMVPVHPDDRALLCMRWEGGVYIDTRLHFGLRSAPIIFTAVADTLEWCILTQGVKYIRHYLDDFITVGSPGSMECAANIAVTLSTCAWLGVPIASDESEGPSTCITFLGIEVDTQKMELRLPEKKLQRVRKVVQQWLG